MLSYQYLFIIDHHTLQKVFWAWDFLDQKTFLVGRFVILLFEFFLVKSHLASLVYSNPHEFFIDLIFNHLLFLTASARIGAICKDIGGSELLLEKWRSGMTLLIFLFNITHVIHDSSVFWDGNLEWILMAGDES